MSLEWRHNGLDGVSNHQPHDCLLSRSFMHRSKNTSKLRITGLWVGNSPVTNEFLAQRASNTQNVSVWWCHRVMLSNTHILVSNYFKYSNIINIQLKTKEFVYNFLSSSKLMPVSIKYSIFIDQCIGYHALNSHTWKYHNMRTTWDPPVTSGFPSQRATNAIFVCMMISLHRNALHSTGPLCWNPSEAAGLHNFVVGQLTIYNYISSWIS